MQGIASKSMKASICASLNMLIYIVVLYPEKYALKNIQYIMTMHILMPALAKMSMISSLVNLTIAYHLNPFVPVIKPCHGKQEHHDNIQIHANMVHLLWVIPPKTVRCHRSETAYDFPDIHQPHTANTQSQEQGYKDHSKILLHRSSPFSVYEFCNQKADTDSEHY